MSIPSRRRPAPDAAAMATSAARPIHVADPRPPGLYETRCRAADGPHAERNEQDRCPHDVREQER